MTVDLSPSQLESLQRLVTGAVAAVDSASKSGFIGDESAQIERRHWLSIYRNLCHAEKLAESPATGQ